MSAEPSPQAVSEPRPRRIALPGRSGEMAALEFGPPARPIDVIFSHANGFNARTYRSLLQPLASLRILAVDMRGHGRTTLPIRIEGRTGWDELLGDLLALAEALDLRDVVLAGHSMGGTVSLRAAAHAPERVRGLVLFDPVLTPPGDSPEALGMIEAMVERARGRRSVFSDRAAARASYVGRGAFKTWPEAMIDDYLQDGLHDRADGQVELACAPEWEASNFRAQNNRAREALEQLTRPALILRAGVGSAASLAALTNLPGSFVTPRTIPHTTHFLPMERPDVVREALLAAAR